MALSGELGKAGHEAESVETEATVHLDKVDDGFAITRIELNTRQACPASTTPSSRRSRKAAKKGCPVSQALAAMESIELDAQLTN